MALLNDVSLYLNVDEFERSYGSDFQFRGRYLCNFVRRGLRRKRCMVTGFGSVAIQGTVANGGGCEVRGERVLVSRVPFDVVEYERVVEWRRSNGDGHEYHEFFVRMLADGVRQCPSEYGLPIAVIEAEVEEFRAGGYRNEWVHCRRVFKGEGVVATLMCAMDTESFVLRLVVERRAVVVCNAIVLKCKPDELIFEYQFKDVKLVGGNVVVLDKFDREVFSVGLGG